MAFRDSFQGWSPGAFQWWPAILPRLTVRRWSIQSRVQAQSGDEGDGLAQGLAAMEQVEDGVAIVPHAAPAGDGATSDAAA